MAKHYGEFWYCNVCEAQNHETDGQCQYCECGGPACKRDNCDWPEHFHDDHVSESQPEPSCPLCQIVASCSTCGTLIGDHAAGCENRDDS